MSLYIEKMVLLGVIYVIAHQRELGFVVVLVVVLRYLCHSIRSDITVPVDWA